MSATTNRAAWITKHKAHPMEIAEAPMPTPSADEVLIQVRAVALNPADAAVQITGLVIKPEKFPYINGTDVSGVVTAVGPTTTRFKPGDRVIGLATAAFRGDTRYGAFQEYMLGTEPYLAKLPDSVGFSEGVVLPLGLCTAARIFWSGSLELDLPRVGTPINSKDQIVLVWGASSSVGANAVLTAKAAGYIVAATASERNFGLLEEMGVDYMFDYNKETVVDEIAATLGKDKKKFAGAFISVFSNPSLKACADAVSKLDGNKAVATVYVPGTPLPEDLPKDVNVIVETGSDFNKDGAMTKLWSDWLSDALAAGEMKCKPNPHIVGKGLDKIQEAVDMMHKGVSGKKLVVEL